MTHDPAMAPAAQIGLIACRSALLEAADIAGGIRALARRLRVPSKQLASWMSGEVKTPRAVLLRALDFLQGAWRQA